MIQCKCPDYSNCNTDIATMTINKMRRYIEEDVKIYNEYYSNKIQSGEIEAKEFKITIEDI